MTPGVEGLLEIAHVGILLGIDARVREQHRKITRRGWGLAERSIKVARKEMKAYSMKNFMVADVPEAERREERVELRLDLFPFGTAMTQVHVTSLSGGRPPSISLSLFVSSQHPL